MYYAMKKIFTIRIEKEDLDWLIAHAHETNQQPTTLVANWIHVIRVRNLPATLTGSPSWGTQHNPALWAK